MSNYFSTFCIFQFKKQKKKDIGNFLWIYKDIKLSDSISLCVSKTFLPPSCRERAN